MSFSQFFVECKDMKKDYLLLGMTDLEFIITLVRNLQLCFDKAGKGSIFRETGSMFTPSLIRREPTTDHGTPKTNRKKECPKKRYGVLSVNAGSIPDSCI